ncbi:Histone-lysine N-methyltransferase [Venturia nashicola]|uniref:Histone-lysine N-methyltransferase n=1 Tax=Venturia nashicola TaxID=86259 RepID=A0A4Z1P9P4_9PEZI|nr:Histone-lysine N-methyltransferase [Venturia nashicola]TLD29651.1 Histone-lysine N-methyltransferase [Venturia nashicola]
MSEKRSQDLALAMPSSTVSTSRNNEQVTVSRITKVKSYLNENIGDDIYVEIELLVLAFGIGIQDATTFPDYLCFASNQTGNTVFLAIETAKIGAKNFPFTNIGFSLAFFILGSLTMGQLGHYLGPTRRLWILLTNLLQTILVIAATVIQYTTPLLTTGPAAWSVISTLAFSSGAQVAMARGLGITEITTAMATAAYVDLVADPKLLVRQNRGRNRRIAFLLVLTAGSFAGAFAHRGVNSAFGLLLSSLIKVGVMVAMAFNRKIERRLLV